MKKLAASAYRRARDFMQQHARPLERALFAHQFEGGARSDVLDALARFQNADGGFGHALEPDVRLPDSSAIATLTGLDVLRDVGTDASVPGLRRALDWVVAQFDPDLPGWRAVPEAVELHPHAPWWGIEHHRAGGSFDPFLVPGARLLSHLQHWRKLMPGKLVDGYADAFRAHVETLQGELGGDGLYYASTVDDARVRAALRPLALANVSREPSAWTTYVAKPLKLAPTPESSLAETLGELVTRNLDWEIEQQSSDGAWEPNWTWFGAYPETWEVARREWRGELTRKTLHSLRAWGRIEGL
jgi:hypothetical protein